MIPSERFREAYQGLARAQKPRRGQAYTVLVNRRLGRVLAAVAYVANRSPNQVTLASGLFTFGGVALVAAGPRSAAAASLAVLLLLTGFALDSADGQLARLRGGGTPLGEWLDHVVDAGKVVSVHLAVLIALYRTGDVSDAPLLLPIGYSVVAVVAYAAEIIRELLLRGGRPAVPVQRQGIASLVIRLPNDYGLLCLVLLLLPWPKVFLVAYGLCLAGNAAFLVAATTRWVPELQP